MGDEGAAISNCLLCDSYALLTLGLLPDRKLARGIKGRAAHEDLLEEFQEKHALKDLTFFLACPTCNAFASASDPNQGFDQVKHGEYLRDGLAVLTPCHLVVFDDEELPPVYVASRSPEAGTDDVATYAFSAVPRRDTRGALTLSAVLTSTVPPPRAVLDRRAPSSDGQEAQHP